MSGLRGFYLIIIISILSMTMFTGQTLYDNNQDKNETFNIYNFTENNLVWNFSSSKAKIKNNFSNKYKYLSNVEIQSIRAKNIINKFVDWVGYTLFEISKWGVEFGYTHPEYHFDDIPSFIKYCLIALIIINLLPILIPLIALIYLIFKGIKKLFLKIKTLNKKDNKNIRK